MGVVAGGAKFLGRVLKGGGGPAAAAFAVPLGMEIGDQVVGPLVRGVHEGLTGEGRRSLFQVEATERLRRQAREMRIRGLQQRMESVRQQLERVDPQLYNEVKAGRKLPPGTTWVGRARTDLMDELAARVALGD